MRKLVAVLIFTVLMAVGYIALKNNPVPSPTYVETPLDVSTQYTAESSTQEASSQASSDDEAPLQYLDKPIIIQVEVEDKPPTTTFKPHSDTQEIVNRSGQRIHAKRIRLNANQITLFRPDYYRQFTFGIELLDDDSQQLIQDWQAYQQKAPTHTNNYLPEPTNTGNTTDLDAIDWDALFK